MKGKKIIIVEDEYIVALDIRNVLERSGYPVVGVFASGEEFLEKFESLEPDLALMDIRLRGELDGIETTRLAHQRRPLPVVMLTAYADDDTVERAKLTEPYAYILKPFEERELRTAIEIALYRAGMEDRLRASEERYRRLFNDGISGNFLTDVEGRITAANPAFLRLVGAAPDAGLPVLSGLFRAEAEWMDFRERLLEKRRLELVELNLRSVEGRDILVLANAAIVPGPDGSMSGIQGELTDTTERRRLEERLLQAQRMEAIGRLAGGIAHDFNNILTSVLGYAKLLGDEIGEQPEAQEDLEGIRKSVTRAADLTRQLLAFSRRQPISLREIDLDALVREAEGMLFRLLPGTISTSLRLGVSPSTIRADPVQVEQILLNLVVNARDAMPSGGTIRIGTAKLALDAPRAVGMDMLAAGSYAILTVADTGIGIDPALFDRIFEPFFSTKSEGHGTGLGLSTVYGIVKQSGGAVEVYSRPGAGARFSVWLPIFSS